MSLFNQRVYSQVSVPENLINYHFNLQRTHVLQPTKLENDADDVVGKPIYYLDSVFGRTDHLLSKPAFKLNRFFADGDQKNKDQTRKEDGSQPESGGGRRRDTGVDHSGSPRPPVRHDIEHGGGSYGSDGFGGGGRNDPI